MPELWMKKPSSGKNRSALVRIPIPDIQHHLAADRQGNLWVVWQGFHGDDSDVFLRRYDGAAWSEEIRADR